VSCCFIERQTNYLLKLYGSVGDLLVMVICFFFSFFDFSQFLDFFMFYIITVPNIPKIFSHLFFFFWGGGRIGPTVEL